MVLWLAITAPSILRVAGYIDTIAPPRPRSLRCPLSGCWVSFDGSMTFFWGGFIFAIRGRMISFEGMKPFVSFLDKNVYYQGRCGATFFKWLHKRYENDVSLTFFALQGDQDVGHAYSGPGANILTHQDVLPTQFAIIVLAALLLQKFLSS